MTHEISQTYLREESAPHEGASPGRADAARMPAKGIPQNVRQFPGRRIFVNQILARMPQGVLDKIARHLKPVYLRRDDYLYQPEDRIDYLYFPETAILSEYQMLDDGRTIEIALTGSESATGIASVFSVCKAANWTQVCTGGTALKIESEIFRTTAGCESPVKALLNDQINSYIRQISHKVICSTHHSVEERLCTWLLLLQDRCGAEPLKLTQEQIARVLGVYRPSVTCIARGLRERGLIDYVRGKIMIRDREMLLDAACRCYGEFSAKEADRTFSQKVPQM